MEDYEIVSDHSYDEEAYYSDQIDSDIEAELYGLIHHDTQNNPISLEDKSDSVERQSVSLLNKSSSPENKSISVQDNLDLSADNSVPLLTKSVTPKKQTNSTEKLKNCYKKNIKNQSPKHNTGSDSFFSDTISNNNLYYSFETPSRLQKIQSNHIQSKNTKKSITPTKRKSEVVSEILGNIQLKKNKKSLQPENSVSKQKKNKQNHSDIMNEENTFVEVIDDSSDSESSIIFFEPDESNLQTNIEKETVFLSSDAEESDSSIEKSLSRACQRKQTAITIESSDLSKTDPWHINYEDKFRKNGARKKSNRYHENAVLTCSKCQLKGHSAKFCSVPKAIKCFFCGDHHSGMNCKNKICTKCFQQGHDRRRCYNRFIETCELCRMKGHSQRNCPDLWRRYHLTTSKGTIVKANPNPHSPLYCYNCGSRGHYGAGCLENRTDRWSFPTWTSVVSYKNPISVLRGLGEERNKFGRIPSFNRRIGNERLPNDTPVHLQKPKKKKKKKSPKTQQNGNRLSTVSPKNAVQNDVYFPRTPKVTPSSSNVHSFRNKWRKQNRRDQILREQMRHQIGLQQRLGIPYHLSTV